MPQLLQADVVVIGAGFSGLQAALSLEAAGLQVHVLEALGRIGGKSYTKPLLSGPGHVELGCTWIDGAKQVRMSALVEKYGLETRKQYLNGVELTLDATGTVHSSKAGDIPSTIETKEVEIYNRVLKALIPEHKKFSPGTPGRPKVSPAYPDTSIGEWLNGFGAQRGQYAYESIRFFCTGIFGREPEEVGLYPFLEMVESCVDFQVACSDDVGGGQHLKIRTGTTSICTRMAGDLRPGTILLDSPVTRIFQDNDHCLVSAGNSTVVQCRKIISTIPATTWNNINFCPPLPKEKRAIFEASQAGHYTKMVLTYPSPWWKELGLLGKFASYNGPVAFSWDISDEKYQQYSIACFIVGQDGISFCDLPRLEREKAVLDNIAQMIDKKHHGLLYDVLEINEQNWFDEKWIHGVTYPSMAAGKLSSLGPALKTPFLHLHFGGTETASVWRGYMEGAVEAGERSAEEVIRAIEDRQSVGVSPPKSRL